VGPQVEGKAVTDGIDVLVVGSANVDLVVKTSAFPGPGETVVGSDFKTYPGGKGANQAVAVARLGGRTALLGCVGKDPHGKLLRETLDLAGVDTEALRSRASVPTGVALITVDASGENSIVVVPGANATLGAEDVREFEHLFRAARVVLLQLETSLEAAAKALEIAHGFGKLAILNPAPAQQVPDSFFGMTDFLTPNRSELEVLTGRTVRTEADAEFAARLLLEKGAGNVVVTLGGRGALYLGRGSKRRVQAFPVRSVDTTAAGDAFNAALALGLARGLPLTDVLLFANAAGALATTTAGAQPSLPDLGRVEKLLGHKLGL